MYCRWDINWYFLQPSPTYIYIHTYIGRQNVNIKNPKLPWESYMKTMSSRDVGTQCVYYTLECYVICIKLLLVALVVWAKQNTDCICSTWLEELLSEMMKKYIGITNITEFGIILDWAGVAGWVRVKNCFIAIRVKCVSLCHSCNRKAVCMAKSLNNPRRDSQQLKITDNQTRRCLIITIQCEKRRRCLRRRRSPHTVTPPSYALLSSTLKLKRYSVMIFILNLTEKNVYVIWWKLELLCWSFAF